MLVILHFADVDICQWQRADKRGLARAESESDNGRRYLMQLGERITTSGAARTMERISKA